MRTILAAAAALFLLVPATAQTTSAKFTSYGSACNSAASLSITGVPQLGTSFTVNGVKWGPLFACTLKLCSGGCVRCNSCKGVHNVLAIGLKKISAPITPTCKLLNTAEFILPGTATGAMKFDVPKDYSLVGQYFYMQRGDVTVAEWQNCSGPSIRLDTIYSMSDGVEGYVNI